MTGDVLLKVRVLPVLLIEQESKIIEFLFESGKSHLVGVVFRFEVVILEELLILEMSVLRLNVV